MTDLYDQRIDAMKVEERLSEWHVTGTADRLKRTYQSARNIDRLAAYKRKRAALDKMMQGVGRVLWSMGYEKA